MKASNTDMVFDIGNLNYLNFKYGLKFMNRSLILRIGIFLEENLNMLIKSA